MVIMKLSAQELLNKFSKSTSHPLEVRRLSMIIFDEVSDKIHEMSNKQRKYLEAAALLHDIGYYIDSKGHNKHSMRMVIENGLEGFTEQDEQIIGCICRYHRGGLPDKNEHEVYNTLDKKERKTVIRGRNGSCQENYKKSKNNNGKAVKNSNRKQEKRE